MDNSSFASPQSDVLWGGLTKRELFALVMAHAETVAPWHPAMGCDFRRPSAEVARYAVIAADMLLAELAKDSANG